MSHDLRSKEPKEFFPPNPLPKIPNRRTPEYIVIKIIKAKYSSFEQQEEAKYSSFELQEENKSFHIRNLSEDFPKVYQMKFYQS